MNLPLDLYMPHRAMAFSDTSHFHLSQAPQMKTCWVSDPYKFSNTIAQHIITTINSKLEVIPINSRNRHPISEIGYTSNTPITPCLPKQSISSILIMFFISFMFIFLYRSHCWLEGARTRLFVWGTFWCFPQRTVHIHPIKNLLKYTGTSFLK